MFTSLLLALASVIVVPVSPHLIWETCPESAVTRCTTIEVPLDWSRPRGKTIDIHVAKRPAEDPARRIGVLFWNPGGPGDGTTDDIQAAEIHFPPEIRQRFDLVGVDPRGFGANDPVVCGVPALTPDTTLFPRTEAQFDAMVRHNRAVGESCQKAGGVALHADTLSVVRDHEAVRRALGERQVTWLGVSYGTQLAANYAEMFPGRTRAMVLDAALEHALPEGYLVATEAAAAEDSFNRFVAWCPTSPECALRGQDVAAEFDRLVTAADRAPIPVEGALHPVSGEDIRMGTKGLLRFKESTDLAPWISWPHLSAGWGNASPGAAAAVARPARLPPPGGGGGRATPRNDYVPQVRTWADMQQRLEMGKQVAPHLQGAAETWQAVLCIGWPVPAANPPRTLHVRGVPTLLAHAAHDTSDPYIWAHGLAAQINGSKLLTRTGDGHTSWWSSPCTRAGMVAHLLRPAATPDNAICEE